jgi:hypothetical protein
MNRHYIYFHRRADDNIVFYVGIGVGRRAYRISNRSEFWKRIVAKHGGFTIEFAHTGLSHSEAKALEVHYISLFGRADRDLGTLCNMTDGGDGRVNYKCTEETKQKMRESSTGVVFTEERKKKIGEKSKEREAWKSAMKNRGDEWRKKISNARKKKVICDGVLYESLGDAARYYNRSIQIISERCRSDRHPSFYYFKGE